jgi:transcriptional enhancer factor
VLPTQALGLAYGPSSYGKLQHRQGQLQQQGRNFKRSSGINPLWLSPEFQNYRKRQAEKDDKSGQKWPEVLEEAFLDGKNKTFWGSVLAFAWTN